MIPLLIKQITPVMPCAQRRTKSNIQGDTKKKLPPSKWITLVLMAINYKNVYESCVLCLHVLLYVSLSNICNSG